MQDTSYSSMDQRHRIRVSMLLQSAPHLCMTRFIDTSTNYEGIKYRLEQIPWSGGHKVIDIKPYEGVIDARLAATYALIYACGVGDLELAMDIIQDLHDLIDINTLIEGDGIIDLTIRVARHGYKARADRAIDICRLLIVCYGSKLKAYHQGGYFMDFCLRYNYVDVVLYLLALYDAEIDHTAFASYIFMCLVICNSDEEAKQYLSHYKNHIGSNCVIAYVISYGSASMFEHVLAVFGTEIETDDIETMFMILCTTIDTHDGDNKIRVMHKASAHRLTAETITEGLIDNWVCQMQTTDQPERDMLGQTAGIVISTFLDLIQDQGIEIALALCCSLQDLKLMDAVLAHNLDQIRSNSGLARHAIIECASHRDIDTFEHILATLGSSICVYALEFWTRAGDLEAVQMVLDTSITDALVLESLPMVLRIACQEGDTELVELLVRSIGDLISESDYRLAFRTACMFGHEDIIRVLARDCSYYLNFRCDADIITCIDMACFNSDIATLINSLFETSIDPVYPTTTVARRGAVNQEKSVSYGSAACAYDLRRISRARLC